MASSFAYRAQNKYRSNNEPINGLTKRPMPKQNVNSWNTHYNSKVVLPRDAFCNRASLKDDWLNSKAIPDNMSFLFHDIVYSQREKIIGHDYFTENDATFDIEEESVGNDINPDGNTSWCTMSINDFVEETRVNNINDVVLKFPKSSNFMERMNLHGIVVKEEVILSQDSINNDNDERSTTRSMRQGILSMKNTAKVPDGKGGVVGQYLYVNDDAEGYVPYWNQNSKDPKHHLVQVNSGKVELSKAYIEKYKALAPDAFINDNRFTILWRKRNPNKNNLAQLVQRAMSSIIADITIQRITTTPANLEREVKTILKMFDIIDESVIINNEFVEKLQLFVAKKIDAIQGIFVDTAQNEKKKNIAMKREYKEMEQFIVDMVFELKNDIMEKTYLIGKVLTDAGPGQRVDIYYDFIQHTNTHLHM